MDNKRNSPVILKSSRKLSDFKDIWLYSRGDKNVNSSTANDIFQASKSGMRTISKTGDVFKITYDTVGFDTIFFYDSKDSELTGYYLFNGVLGKQPENYNGDLQLIIITISSSSDESNIDITSQVSNSLSKELRKSDEDTFGRYNEVGEFPKPADLISFVEEKESVREEKYSNHLRQIRNNRDMVGLLDLGCIKSDRKNLLLHFVHKPFFNNSNIFLFSSSADYDNIELSYYNGKQSLVIWSKVKYYILNLEEINLFGNFRIFKIPTDFPESVKSGAVRVVRSVPGRFILSDGTTLCQYLDKLETWPKDKTPIFDETSKYGDYYLIPKGDNINWDNIGYDVPGLVPPSIKKPNGLIRKIGPWLVYKDPVGNLIYSGQTYSVSIRPGISVFIINDRVLITKEGGVFTAYYEPPKKGILYSGKEEGLTKFKEGDKLGNTYLRFFTRGFLSDPVPSKIIGSLAGSLYYIKNNKYINYL